MDIDTLSLPNQEKAEEKVGKDKVKTITSVENSAKKKKSLVSASVENSAKKKSDQTNLLGFFTKIVKSKNDCESIISSSNEYFYRPFFLKTDAVLATNNIFYRTIDNDHFLSNIKSENVDVFQCILF